MIKERGWERFATYGDELAAKVVVDYLHRHDCPARISGSAGTSIDSGVHVLVPGEFLHRARWLWAQADSTEQELHYLVSGELPDAKDEPADK
jgi:hypothetical protein